MQKLPFNKDYFHLNRTASGHFSLEITDKMSWESFPEYALKFLSVVDGIVEKKNSSADMHIWDVTINGFSYQLVFDDYPCAMSLESSEDASDKNLFNIKEILLVN